MSDDPDDDDDNDYDDDAGQPLLLERTAAIRLERTTAIRDWSGQPLFDAIRLDRQYRVGADNR